MQENSTQNLLLLYAYNEAGLSASDAAQRLIDGDPIIRERYSDLTRTIASLDAFFATPSEECVRRILAQA